MNVYVNLQNKNLKTENLNISVMKLHDVQKYENVLLKSISRN